MPFAWDRKLLAAREIAELLNHPLEWFYRHRGSLEREQGFPAPVPGCGQQWDPCAVHAWLDSKMRPELLALVRAERAAVTDPAAEAIDDAYWEHLLDENAAAIATAPKPRRGRK